MKLILNVSDNIKMTHKTIYHKDFEILESDHDFTYQKELTDFLDSDNSEFDQNKLNEIVLWKVNRYAKFESELIKLLNSISPFDTELDVQKTNQILKLLLRTKGVQLAMASAILRFRNDKIYQIIDQRVFRIIYEGEVLKLSNSESDKNIETQIDMYLRYLNDLKKISQDLNIPFEKSDRILYKADKRINKKIKIKY
ncbi:hypothetical protein KMW28_24760 [Flammeovirga yaeyamensis]|uniref:Uncharacterized protein n=1 Tax=Flammeovirga yaeyamensis TaxID=367791 RepID=A0AAX1N9H4_9BACT|nr:hypothetical protein [Flammeovirga yaeyamensis]MBB3699499.1 hypothetical protein [Flammeovirga yaeyamensis]NMF35244.1 hypothetical protein [Flammeovirga yaeyamensis]QWG04105.1 hypothetical protein KMW28_24760 [Flammeovirga yaeyamensis]